MPHRFIKIGLLLLPLLIFWGFNHQNIPLQFSLLMGLIALPYVIRIDNKTGGYRYAIAALLAGIVLLFFRTSSLYYFSAVFILLFIIERWWGRINHLPLLVAIAVSPIIGNIVYIWSFPIRLQLSQWTVKVLSWAQFNIKADGNLLLLDGHSFSVDPACIGLKMVVTSVVLGLVIIAYFEKKYKRSISISKLFLWVALLLVAAIFSNFIRLITLILFHILPENPMHDVVGVLSLVCYVLLPFYFLLAYAFSKSKKEHSEGATSIQQTPKRKVAPITKVALASLLLLQVVNGRQFLSAPVENIQLISDIQIEGFQKKVTPNGVLKLQSDEALIYVKPPVRFFQGSHDPRFCWQGSGYTFSSVQIEELNEKRIYTALLTKGEDQLYSAWWYENEKLHTPHEWDWRWKTFQGDGGYAMININCPDRVILEKWIAQFKVNQ